MCWGSSIYSASERTVIPCPSICLVSFTVLWIYKELKMVDMRFLQQWLLRSSGMWYYVVWNKCTSIVGDDSAAFISRVEIRYHTGGGGGHTIISHKVKYILYRYFPDYWRLWRAVILYAGVVWYTILHNLLPLSTTLHGISLQQTPVFNSI